MSESASESIGIAERYATAVFEIAKADKSLDTLERDVDSLDTALKESRELRDVIRSPIYSREDKDRAMDALGQKMGLSDTLRNTLRLMASKRRLFVVPVMIEQLRDKIADERGIVHADVRAARPLTDAQRDQLAETLKSSVGKDVKMNVAVDESLIGGLVVKVGSKMIDTSIRSKLMSLQNTMKEVR